MMSKLWVENDQQIPAVVYQDAQPAGSFTEITTSITGWYAYWNDSGKDYLFARDRIAELIDSEGGFSSLDAQKKAIACEFNIGDIDDWLTLIDNDTVVQLSLLHKQRVASCLQIRAAYAEAFMKSNFYLTDLHDMLDDVHKEILNFIIFGVIGKPEHGISGVKDYLLGTNKFLLTGFMFQTWQIKSSLTRAQIRDQLYQIIIEGNY